MILVYDEILERIEKYEKYKDVYGQNKCKPLVEEYKIENIQSASYDVSIGNTIMVESSNIKTVDLREKNDIELVFEERKIDDFYTIKPNEYIIVALNEIINMPDDLCAHIRPRTTFNKLGLIITSQHVNPSFSGILKIGIKNMTSYAFKIYPYTTVGQIVFERLSGKVREDKLYRNIETAKYQNEGKEFIHSKVYDEEEKKIAEKLFEKLLNRGIKNESNESNE